MNYEEAIEAVERHRRHLVDRRAIDTVEVSIELADVCLKALRGWQAVDYVLNTMIAYSVTFMVEANGQVSCAVLFNCDDDKPIVFTEAPDPATAAIAAQEEA